MTQKALDPSDLQAMVDEEAREPATDAEVEAARAEQEGPPPEPPSVQTAKANRAAALSAGKKMQPNPKPEKETAVKKHTRKTAAKKTARKTTAKKSTVKRDSMAGHAYELIQAGKTNAEVLAALKTKYHLPEKHSYYPGWYRAKLVMTGAITREWAAKHSGAPRAQPKKKG